MEFFIKKSCDSTKVKSQQDERDKVKCDLILVERKVFTNPMNTLDGARANWK